MVPSRAHPARVAAATVASVSPSRSPASTRAPFDKSSAVIAAPSSPLAMDANSASVFSVAVFSASLGSAEAHAIRVNTPIASPRPAAAAIVAIATVPARTCARSAYFSRTASRIASGVSRPDAAGGGCAGSFPAYPRSSPRSEASLMAASSRNTFGATVPTRRLASHTSFARSFPTARKRSSAGRVHASRSNAKERTLLTCAPRCLCAPAHRWHTTTQRFMLAQSGSAPPQSAHASFPGAAASTSRGSRSTVVVVIVVAAKR